MFRKIYSLALTASLFVSQVFLGASEGKVINPISDVCWECLFPITVSSANVTPAYKDQASYKEIFCWCHGMPPKAGIPVSFWEPTVLIDVTRHPYKLMGLGGISVGKETVKNRGSVAISSDGPSQTSFYHVHYYKWPMMAWLGILEDFACVTGGELDVAYMSELDPTWNDEQLNFVLNAEAALFSSPPAQVACMADCATASLANPRDELFWCAGCSGSLYPLIGTVAHHQGGVQASFLLVQRVIAKLHRLHILKGYTEKNFCEPEPMPIIKKSLYKTQLVYPVAQKSGPCHPLGSSSVLWGAGKSYPGGGEDFVYLIWKKNQCCLDAVKASGSASCM